MDLMQAFNNKYLKAEPPVAEVGDTVRVHVHIKEGNRERIQVFEGTVIAKKHGGIEETITVRRISYGVGRKRCSPSTLPPLRRSRPSARVRSAARSSITCATAWARALRSRSASESWILGCGEATASPQPFYKYFFCNTEAHISIPRSIICEK